MNFSKITTKKLVLVVFLAAVFLGVLFWQIGDMVWGNNKKEDQIVELTWWNLGEEEKVYSPVVEAYTTANPSIKINYVKQSRINYRPRLQTQLKAGQGPDIFLIHSSWLPMFFPDLSPSPELVLNVADFTKDFYPVFKDSLVLQNKIYGLPTEVNGLVLYYNEDIIKAAGLTPPTDWPQLVVAARQVTVKNASGQIQTAGVSLGTTSNVDFWPEIISLLFLQQPQGSLVEPANSDGAEVLKFYTNFITDPKNKTWDVNLPPSSQMFTEGKLAFYFAPISKLPEIKQAAPNLNFKVATLPQLPGKTVGVGSFWVWAVSGKSQHPQEAWEFVRFLGLPEVLQFLTPTDNLNKIYPRMEMGKNIATDPLYAPFLLQAPYLKSWYLNSGLSDGAINEEMIKTYSEAIQAVLAGSDPQIALSSITPQIREILDKYQVNP